ncbi:MAG: hypothetical protein L0Z55_10445 [Planctomycetes bacterium]|nr:hypothetical protein [Planctomycetota bacterium]
MRRSSLASRSERGVSRRAAVALAIGLAALPLVAGCSDLPFRVEFGRQRTATAAVADAPADTHVQANADTAWIAWDCLHRDLERIIAGGREGWVPAETFSDCRTALARVEKYYPDRAAPLRAGGVEYSAIEKRAANSPPSSTLSRLREVAKSLRKFREEAPRIAVPPAGE